jgi:hypothetical protein
MAGKTMAQEFQNMQRTYRAIQRYNEEQVETLKSLAPFQKKDKIRLVRALKYFPEVQIGAVATVASIDWNKEYNYLVSVSFPHIPKRYFWMPAYLFRSADWVEKKGTWTRKVKKLTMKVTEVDGAFSCKLFSEDQVVSEFTADTLDNGLDTLEMVWHSYKITHR